MYKTSAKTIHQARKQFNRLKTDGQERTRLRDVMESGKRRFGRKMGRTKTPEQEYQALIKEGIVRVTRRRGHYPLIEVKWNDGWVELSTFNLTDEQAEEVEARIAAAREKTEAASEPSDQTVTASAT